MTVRLEPLEDFLAVMQDRRRGIEAQGAVRLDPGIPPFAAVRALAAPLDLGHVVRHEFTEPGSRQNLG